MTEVKQEYDNKYNLPLDEDKIINHEVKVRRIFEEVGDYSGVSIDIDNFNKVRSARPELPYQTTHNSKGQGVRYFNFNGTLVFTRWIADERATRLFMRTEDAQEKLSTVDDEREGEVGIACDI